jgi:hypothetical protein
MNTINKILGKNISSIIFRYLTVNKNVIKLEYIKNMKYLRGVYWYFFHTILEYKPSNIKMDNKYFRNNFIWDVNEWRLEI